MNKRCVFLVFVVLLYCSCVESDLNKACENYCSKTYPEVSLVNITCESCCEQGCRMFPLIDMVKDNTDLNRTVDACRTSCKEAYSISITSSKDTYACNRGCDSMFKYNQDFSSEKTFHFDYVAYRPSLPKLLIPGTILFALVAIHWICSAPTRRTTKLENVQSPYVPSEAFDLPPKYSVQTNKL